MFISISGVLRPWESSREITSGEFDHLRHLSSARNRLFVSTKWILFVSLKLIIYIRHT
jgi:hypothetical protein